MNDKKKNFFKLVVITTITTTLLRGIIMAAKYGIHWFRRDLRIAGNEALSKNIESHDGQTLGVFCFDAKFLSRDDFSYNRFQFFLHTLKSLKQEMNNLGGDLLVLNKEPEESFVMVLRHLEKHNIGKPNQVTWNRDYEPYAIKRDEKLKEYFRKQKIETKNFRDHLIIEPHELTKKSSDTEGYQVYTPFSRMWLSLFSEENNIAKRTHKEALGLDYLESLKKKSVKKLISLKWKDLFSTNMLKDHLDKFIESNKEHVKIDIPEAGTLAALKQLDEFKEDLTNYGKHRDVPHLQGTSRMSMFLKNGSITTAHIINELNLRPYDKKATTGHQKYLSELIWREFYYHALYRNPENEKEAFLKKYKDLKWHNNKKWFEAWKEGKTGFPIVDAGMRELKTTGWMHNRVRMIVASFLTKDLLIDWQWGEQYFMEVLLDGDLAANNGGWQWAASTGCDPQPYFRIFNPWTQSSKFDPDAIYIKRYVEELKDCDPKQIHSEEDLRPESYPRPIVDHSAQRKIALELYKNV